MLLADTETQLEDICAISAELPRAIVFANNDIYELKNAVKSYIAVKYLESQKTKYTEKDPAFEKELQYFREELHVEILSAIQSWKENYGDFTLIVSSGEILESVHSSASLSSAASSIMEAYYPETLIVNNELINKNVISGSITSAKKNVISNAIKGCKPAEYYEVQYLSPDYIAVRSVLVKNGFIESEENVEQNALPDGRMPQNAVKEIITQYVNRSKTETVIFEELITALKEPPFGLRNGYLSLLISHVLVPHRKSLIISSHGVEQEITVDLFEEIVRRPADYSFTIANWDSEQTDYLDALEHIYSDYINEASLSKNRLKAIYDAMMSHYKNVSKFARTTQTYVSDDAKNYRRILEKSTANYSTFLFAKVKSIGGNYAINQRKKISFQKIEYNIKKERVLHHGGERYTFSPYSLVWDGDNYYVVGYSDKYQAIGSHRVDRIAACPCILDESAVPQPVGFDVSKYIKTTFRMYNAPRAEVELLCDNSVMDAIIDRFGPDVQTYAGDLQNFRVIEEIAVGKVFFNWIFGFEGKVRIKGPESVKNQYREMVMSAMDLV